MAQPSGRVRHELGGGEEEALGVCDGVAAGVGDGDALAVVVALGDWLAGEGDRVVEEDGVSEGEGVDSGVSEPVALVVGEADGVIEGEGGVIFK